MISNKEARFADLHIHTTYSDGMLLPEEVVEKAVGIGLGAVAVTDHDCVKGISPAVSAARETGLEVIPGIEISAVAGDMEIHVLGYFIDWKDPSLAGKLEDMLKNRVDRMMKMICCLRESGMEIDADEVFGMVRGGTVGRLHLARVMADSGLVRTRAEVFDKYIGNGKPCFFEHEHLDYTKAIDMIKDAGGVPVLGHPGVSKVDAYIPEIISAGIKGIEVFHPDHNAACVKKYMELAKEHALIATGGSDCHGSMKKDRIRIGKITVDRDTVETLRSESGYAGGR